MEPFEVVLPLDGVVLEVEILLLSHLNFGLGSVLFDCHWRRGLIYWMEVLKQVENFFFEVLHVLSDQEALLTTFYFLVVHQGFLQLVPKQPRISSCRKIVFLCRK